MPTFRYQSALNQRVHWRSGTYRASVLFKAISGDRSPVGYGLTVDLIHKSIWILLKSQQIR